MLNRCAALAATFALFLVAPGFSWDKLSYPHARKSDHVDVYHGVKIPDPYRWLEEPRSDETLKWIEEQNAISFPFLAEIPRRERIEERLTELWNYERYSTPRERGGKYFYEHNDGLQQQAVLYVTDSPGDDGRVLLDPNTLSEDGTVSLAGYAISKDGRYLAYGLSTAGSDWEEWKVREVATGEDRKDHLKWVKFSGASWLPDGSGFYYSRYDEPNEETKLEETNYYQKLYFHRLGDPQSKDRLVYHRPDQKEWGFDGHVTESGDYLIISVWQGTERKNAVFYKDLSDPQAEVIELLPEFDAYYVFAGNEGPRFWFRTDRDAPRGRLVEINVNAPDERDWKELVPQAEETLRGVSQVGEVFIASYLEDAHSRVRVFDLEGEYLRDVKLPGIGSAGGFSGERGDRETFYSFSGFTTPTTVYRYDVVRGESRVWRKPKVEFDPERFETKQVFFTSKDGTRAPMFLSYKKGLKLAGNNPTLLYGYGGFNIAITPSFSVTNVAWMELGGVYAAANLRGGGEYGQQWHESGRLHLKQNVFDDFIAAAEWLIDNKYTSSERLAITGRSNGGLLVGAAITQRPELFAAALPGVGVMDMLRFHKFTIGWAWVPEYGSSDDEEQFRTLLSYSPLHNLRPGVKYPATLITTADHDDRVVPAHSYKFAAALQAAQAGEAPVLIRIETSAGHGAGTPTSKRIAQAADELAFLTKALNMDQREPR